jgi:hypothetical protein
MKGEHLQMVRSKDQTAKVRRSVCDKGVKSREGCVRVGGERG